MAYGTLYNTRRMGHEVRKAAMELLGDLLS